MKTILIFLTKAYQIILSPFMTSFFGHACRFEPTCSRYFIDAISLHGVIKGSTLSVRRVARCHPRTPSVFDPVPAKA